MNQIVMALLILILGPAALAMAILMAAFFWTIILAVYGAYRDLVLDLWHRIRHNFVK